MTDHPQISVVTITYGHEHYITQTLDGVLMQNYSGEIEFIIANDNSPDNTDQVIQDYFSTKVVPPNFTIKYTRHKINKAVMPNFLWALQQATGNYIAICEGDDYWTDSLKLQKQVDLLQGNRDISMCFTSRTMVDMDGLFLSNTQILQKTWTTKEIVLGYVPPTQTIFSKNYEKEFIEFMKNHSYSYGGDKIYSYFCSLKGKLFSIEDNTATYRVHSGGVHSRYSIDEKNKLHIEQSLLFFKAISNSNKEEEKWREDFFSKKMLENLFFIFSDPKRCVSQTMYLIKKHKIGPKIIMISFQNFLIYYWGILKKKIQ